MIPSPKWQAAVAAIDAARDELHALIESDEATAVAPAPDRGRVAQLLEIASADMGGAAHHIKLARALAHYRETP